MCLVLALLTMLQLRAGQLQAQPECPGQMDEDLTYGKLNGHWWIQASSCDHMIYIRAFADGGGAPPTEDAVNRYYQNGHLDVQLREAFYQLFGSANR